MQAQSCPAGGTVDLRAEQPSSKALSAVADCA